MNLNGRSKMKKRAAFAAFSSVGSFSERISNDSSIFTAEVEAIRSALEKIVENNSGSKFIIFSDSKSVLECIQNQDSRNPIVISLLDQLQRLRIEGFIIKFCWVPSHVGIKGNEEADSKAKEALNKTEPSQINFPIKITFLKLENLLGINGNKDILIDT